MYKLDRSHKALLLLASVVVKSFLMSIVSSYVFCGSINPYVLFFHCINNVPFVGVSIAAVALIGVFFGYYITKLKPFDSIFPNLMMGGFYSYCNVFWSIFLCSFNYCFKSNDLIIWCVDIGYASRSI
jgi:hypothetical protein